MAEVQKTQQEIDQELVNAVIEYEDLWNPVEPKSGEEYYAFSKGKDVELAEKKEKISDLLFNQNANPNALDKEGDPILARVTDWDLAHDFIEAGADTSKVREELEHDVSYFKKEMSLAEADSPLFEYNKDMMNGASEMIAAYKREDDYFNAVDTFDKLVGDNGAFKVDNLGFDKKTNKDQYVIHENRTLTPEEREQMGKAIAFFKDELNEAGFEQLETDVKGFYARVGEHPSFKSYDEPKKTEAIDRYMADGLYRSGMKYFDTINQRDAKDNEYEDEKKDLKVGAEYEGRDGDDAPTGFLPSPKGTQRADEHGEVSFDGLLRSELHVLADRSNPVEFADAVVRAREVVVENPEYVNAKSKDIYEVSPLMCAVNKGNPEMMSLLIDQGADVNAENAHGETAMMYAAYHGDVGMMRALFEKGADPGKVAGAGSLYEGMDIIGIMQAQGHDEKIQDVMLAFQDVAKKKAEEMHGLAQEAVALKNAPKDGTHKEPDVIASLAKKKEAVVKDAPVPTEEKNVAPPKPSELVVDTDKANTTKAFFTVKAGKQP